MHETTHAGALLRSRTALGPLPGEGVRVRAVVRARLGLAHFQVRV